MSGQFLISAIPEIRLFTHSFALDTILAELADSALYNHRFFSAYHTPFFSSASTMNVSLITGFLLPDLNSVAPSIHNLDLCGRF